MSSILRYKDALPFREENVVAPKINHISNLALVKHHMIA
jgi:hypothetical protein